jgi:hypothetical protein
MVWFLVGVGGELQLHVLVWLHVVSWVLVATLFRFLNIHASFCRDSLFLHIVLCSLNSMSCLSVSVCLHASVFESALITTWRLPHEASQAETFHELYMGY